MRIIDSASEARQIAELLPSNLQVARPSWDSVESSSFRLRSDLLYFDVVLPANLKWMPKILHQLGCGTCFIFNHQSLLLNSTTNGNDIAIELTSKCEPDEIAKEFGNEGKDHGRYLSVFYFAGDFGIVSADADWFVFARTDDRALFTSKTEQAYSEFNERWWHYAGKNRSAVR